MKKLLLLIFAIFTFIHTNAQTWAPIGAEWTYGITNHAGPEKYYENWVVRGDTVIEGKSCRLIRVEGRNLPQHMKFITYEDSNIVYWYNFNDTFTVLYDFNKNKGESWQIWNDT